MTIFHVINFIEYDFTSTMCANVYYLLSIIYYLLRMINYYYYRIYYYYINIIIIIIAGNCPTGSLIDTLWMIFLIFNEMGQIDRKMWASLTAFIIFFILLLRIILLLLLL